jgi:hypothetical protein
MNIESIDERGSDTMLVPAVATITTTPRQSPPLPANVSSIGGSFPGERRFLNKLSGVTLSVTELHKGDKMMACSQHQWKITWPCGGEESLEEEVGEQTPVQTRSVVGKSRSKRKYVAPLVQSSERRFTRSCLKSDGYRPAPILVVQPKIKKKTRARNLLMPEK